MDNLKEFLTELSVVPYSLWIGFTIGVLILLIVDLALFGHSNKKMHWKTGLIESILWISVALGFNLWFAYQFGWKLGSEFLTAYVVEKSLSVDNLFVILLIFQSLRIPDRFQHRVLFYGIFGAVVFRAIFILIGAKIIHHFHWVLYIFGIILVYSAYSLITRRKTDQEKEESKLLRKLRSILPTTTLTESEDFFVRKDGRLMVTPLFLALATIEISDIFFAVDSIPAVFAVTNDAFVAFASNILAILGLRALFFVLADGVSKLKYLEVGLAFVLGFIGLKMLIEQWLHIPSWVSLIVIAVIFITTGIMSFRANKTEKKSL